MLEIQLCITGINYILINLYIKNGSNISQYICLCYTSDLVNTVLMSTRVILETFNLVYPDLLKVVYLALRRVL